MQCEDEWSEMHQRFKKEGLDADSLKLEDRLLQVWRWLVDAESNLRNSRRMLDKLYEQQHEEIEEMENYVGKMKKLAEKRATDVEAECSVLKLEKTELLELLDGFGALGDSIYEKVLFLGEEKVKAAEDLEILKNMKLPSNGVNSDILTEMIKVSSEKESLKREVTEMRERIHLLEKSSRQLEIDNDRLSFKGDCFIPSRFGCSSSFTLSRVFVMVLLMVFNVQSLSSSPLVIDLNAPCKKIDRFWTHTGFSPLDSSYGATQSLLLSKDEKINLALISALPNRSISHVRIHWLLNLVYKKNLKYDWSKLDEILDWIVTLKLNMIFEIMGLPQSDSSPHSLNWSEFCSELANHIVARYGQEVVKNWIFELWNEPDLKQYNIANFTTESYLHYAKSCIDGIRSQLPNALIGGPAGLFKNTTNHKLCWGFLEECNSLRNRCNIDFISFHKKAFPEDLLAESLKLALSIQREFPTLWKLPFFNSEADLMSGWWKPRGWRGDVYYAASIVQVVHLFILNNLQNLFMGISNDNGFLNMSPFFFDQRTLLTRFNMSFSNCTQFFKKPVYVATALLGKLENNVVSIGSDSNSSLSGIPSINSCKNASSSTVILTTLGQGNPITKSIEIVFPFSWGPGTRLSTIF
uniref:Alpha-L-iduronidase n=1 Tax=Lygus hesperus TaxID=30085 RepID=A0A0A9XXG0_LYGHE